MTRQVLAGVIAAILIAGIVQARGTAPVADLSITNTDGMPTYTAGGSVTYTIVVGNSGPDAVTGAGVIDAVTALPQVTGATWTCVGDGGATCSGGTIIGNIADTINLPVGGTATYTLIVKLSSAASGNLVNTATVTPPAGTTDPVPDPTPNTATDTDTAATIFSVAPEGLDSPTCGTSAAPCKTIQAAIDRTSAGDTVLVADGTYRECIVLMPGDGMGGVLVESSQFLNSGVVGAAILDGDAADGTDVCGSLAHPGPVAKVFDKSALVGMSIANGDDSGVWGLGAVTISNNVIASNTTATTGAGIRLVTGTYLTNPPASARITSNVIRDNTSGSHGAGIYVEAKAQIVPSAVTISGNNISTNTAGGTMAASGAGIAVFTDTATVTDLSQVLITTNTLNANVANGPAAGAANVEGGGIFVATGEGNGLGTETVTIGATGSGNVVRNNVSAGFGGGISVKARPAPGGTQTIAVAANTVSANTGNFGGGGVHLFARAFDRPVAAPVLALTASGNALTGNHALGLLTDPLAAGGGGILAELHSERTAASGVQYEISGNAIQSNASTTHGGGASLVASADDDPQSNGAVQPTGALIAFHNNLVATNAARDMTALAPSGGGVHGLAVARGASAVASLSASFLTVADNQTEIDTGGVEWQDLLLPDSLGSPGTASFTLSNSIVSGNDGYGVGFPVPLQPSTTLGFSYVDAYGNISGNYEPPLPDPTGSNGNISIDPELDELFLPRICGPMVDAGDPALAATNEPLPNGGVVNLGHLGNTASATRTFPDVNSDGTVDGLDVMGIAVSFNSVTGGARYFLAADRDLNGIVDGADLAYVSGFYAQTCP